MVGWVITIVGFIIIWLTTVRRLSSTRIRAQIVVKLLCILCLVLQLTTESTHSHYSSYRTLENVFTAGIWVKPEEPQIPIETGSAWAGDIPFSTGIAKYFTYKLNEGTQEAPLEANLYQGADFVLAGHVLVWNTQSTLYVKIVSLPTYSFDLTHMYPGSVPPNKHSPGNLGYQYTSDYMSEYTYTVTSIYTIWDNKPDHRSQVPVESLTDGETIYIAVHAQIVQSSKESMTQAPLPEGQNTNSHPHENPSGSEELQDEQPGSEDNQEHLPDPDQSQPEEPEEGTPQEIEPKPGELQEEQPGSEDNQECLPDPEQSQPEESEEGMPQELEPKPGELQEEQPGSEDNQECLPDPEQSQPEEPEEGTPQETEPSPGELQEEQPEPNEIEISREMESEEKP